MSMPGDILIIGANGQLGMELQRCQWPSAWVPVALDRKSLDLRDSRAIAKKVAERRWAAIINCAAYTAVDKAEVEIAAAWAVNASAPAALAQACRASDTPLLHVSTDYVFSGNKTGAWEIDDPVAPINVYGASKLAGELAVCASGCRHAIVRTSWLVGAHGSNFVKTMLRLAQAHATLNVVDDQTGSPTSAADLAAALMKISIAMVEDPQLPSGTFHFSNTGSVSWAGFAAQIFRESAERGGVKAIVVPIATAEYPTAAKRPLNSVLDHQAIRDVYGIEPRPWEMALSDIMDELIGEANSARQQA